MKKITLYIITTCLLLAFYPSNIQAKNTTIIPPLAVSKPAESAEAKVLLVRLNEIQAMDKSNLKSSEKKQLRKEVRSIKQELREIGDGVYISAGALIVIILLLIILM